MSENIIQLENISVAFDGENSKMEVWEMEKTAV